MGYKCAPELANLFMSRFENQFILNSNIYLENIIVLKRFLDGIFLIWKGPVQFLLACKQFVNSVHVTIKFELKYDSKKINFLDVEIKRVGDRIETDTYRKPTDANSFLVNDSFHPQH